MSFNLWLIIQKNPSLNIKISCRFLIFILLIDFQIIKDRQQILLKTKDLNKKIIVCIKSMASFHIVHSILF